MEDAGNDPLTTLRRVFVSAGNSPGRVAQALCDLIVAQGWAPAARLSWSPAFAAMLTEAGEPAEPLQAGEPAGPHERELGAGPQGSYSLRLAAPLLPDPHGLTVAAAMAAGLDVWLDAWQRGRSMQVALRQAEQDRVHFQRLFDTVPVSTAIVALDRSIVDVNRVFCERFGITRDQAIGRNLNELGLGYLEEDRLRMANELRDKRSVRNMTLRGWRHDGTIGTFLFNADLTDFDGEVRALVSSLDITDLLAAEAAILARAKAEADSQAKGEMLARIAADKLESDRLRGLADQARTDLQRLSELGRRVTASLDPLVIVTTLRAGLATLMPTDGLRVLVLDGEQLEPIDEAPDPAGSDDEPAVDPHRRELRRCVEAPSIATLARTAAALPWAHAPPGARSALAAPLRSQHGPIGLMVVYARAPRAYGATHRAMLETLALHVAGAIVNSRAYAQLQLAQAQLVEREKMAALGSLVAGVAHELNTPLGNALLLTSTLNERVQALPAQPESAEAGAQTLTELTDLMRQAGRLIERSLRSAALLVSSFKQVAVDQTTDRRRNFDLAVLVCELAATLRPQLLPHHHELVVEIPPDIEFDSYPGPLSQVLTNLILNAQQHGLAGRNHGRISIVAARWRKAEVLIDVSDDGAGITKADLRRVFEPFFTTRLGGGGTGLGLSVSYNIVTAMLGGSIQASSPPGGGARFRIVLPLNAPDRPPPPARTRLPGLR